MPALGTALEQAELELLFWMRWQVNRLPIAGGALECNRNPDVLHEDASRRSDVHRVPADSDKLSRGCFVSQAG